VGRRDRRPDQRAFRRSRPRRHLHGRGLRGAPGGGLPGPGRSPGARWQGGHVRGAKYHPLTPDESLVHAAKSPSGGPPTCAEQGLRQPTWALLSGRGHAQRPRRWAGPLRRRVRQSAGLATRAGFAGITQVSCGPLGTMRNMENPWPSRRAPTGAASERRMVAHCSSGLEPAPGSPATHGPRRGGRGYGQAGQHGHRRHRDLHRPPPDTGARRPFRGTCASQRVTSKECLQGVVRTGPGKT
jgi:hypothetical protein